MPEDSINSYYKAVNNLALNKSDYLFRNNRPECAAIVLATLFRYSNKNVRIYDQCISGDIADMHESFSTEMTNFLNRSGQLQIVLQNEEFAENSHIFKDLEKLLETHEDQIDIRIASKKFQDNVCDLFEKNVYFAVNDNNGFRLETTELLKEKRQAICSFNNSHTANKLNQSFNKNFSSCSKANLPNYML